MARVEVSDSVISPLVHAMVGASITAMLPVGRVAPATYRQFLKDAIGTEEGDDRVVTTVRRAQAE
jgi:hypothetical protein